MVKKLLLNVENLNAAISGKNTKAPVGHAVDHFDRWYVIFVDTDRKTGEIRRSKNGKSIMFNFRAQQDRPKVQAAQTLGQTLPQTEAEMAAFAKQFAGYLANQAPASTEATAEEDFSELNDDIPL